MIINIEPRAPLEHNTVNFWEGFLTEDQINRLLARKEWFDLNKGMVGGRDSSPEGKINNEIRETDIAWMNIDEDNFDIWKSVSETISDVNRRFYGFDLDGCYEMMQLGLYNAKFQSHYDWHMDGSLGSDTIPRKLSMVICLSDPEEFEGGELQVKINSDKAVTLEQQKGRAWFFPSWIVHRVTPVTSGIRRSAVIWAGGPQFK